MQCFGMITCRDISWLLYQYALRSGALCSVVPGKSSDANCKTPFQTSSLGETQHGNRAHDKSPSQSTDLPLAFRLPAVSRPRDLCIGAERGCCACRNWSSKQRPGYSLGPSKQLCPSLSCP